MKYTFEQIRAFQAVAKYLSFSKAASHIYRTQSAVSIQVSKLEETLGQCLFARTTKNIELTEAGKIFYHYLSKIEGLFEEAEQELQDLKKMKKGHLAISTSDTTACYRLPEIMKNYKKKYPGIEIQVKNATSLKTIESVMNHEVDFGIATLRFLPPELSSIPLFSREDLLICHPDHPLAIRKKIYLKDLEAYPFILLDQNCSSRRILDETLKANNVILNITMELSSIEVVKQFVGIDAGVSVVPKISVSKEILEKRLSALRVEELTPSDPIKMGIIFKKGRYLSMAAHSFLKMLGPRKKSFIPN